ncbi:MAG: peptide chain release factor N(5)-glutamine methyltransferase, partial [Candidatus Cloacimonadaceae bacterium]
MRKSLNMLPRSSKLLTELLKTALQKSDLAGVESHKVKLLLSEITAIPIPALTLNREKVLSEEQAEHFQSALQRLLAHEPVQYILGKTGFYGLQILVNENVLIPRPETEGLVEWIAAREQGCLKVLEIGTGSGAIALALKKLKPEFDITATDISVQAIKLAVRNARQLGLQVTFQVADLFPKNNFRYDVIVSNPPYVSSSEYALLADEIRFYEPRLALL